MRRSLPKVILALLSCCVSAGAYQNVARFERISSDHGLSQNTVFSIAQDHQGFMWFSTQDGVNRYDGHSFIVFRQALSDSNSLSNNFCGPLLVDRQGRLWIGTEGSGVDMFDPRTATFRNFRRGAKGSPPSRSDAIAALEEDPMGRIWVGTRSGLGTIDPDRTPSRMIEMNPGIPGNLVGALLRDREHRMWVGTETGAFVNSGEGTEFRRLAFEDAESRHVQGLVQDEEGVIWATTSRGLYRFDPSGSEFRTAHPFLAGKDLGAIVQDGDGNLWIGSVPGLVEYRPAARTFRIHTHNSSDPSSLSSNAVISAFRDRSGVLWFGSFSGLHRHAPMGTKFLTYRHSPADPGSISNSNVRSVCEDHTGALWISTLNGLNRLFPGGRRFIRYVSSTSGVSSDLIWSIREQRLARRSILWAGTNAHGVDEISVSPDGSPGFRQHLKGRSIASIAIDSSGLIWAGDLNGEIYRYDPARGRFAIVPISNDKRVVTLHADRHGDLWIGTLGNGAIRYRPSTGETRSFRHDPSNRASLTNDHAISFCEGRDGTMWIGTYAGLNGFRPDGSFVHLTTRDGLPNDVIYAILTDDRGHLWLSTNKGLARFDPETSAFRNFDDTDGLQGNEFNQGAAYRAGSGVMYFGGINGISVFHPDSISRNQYIPSVIITDFRILQRSVRSDSSKGRLDGPIEYAKSITLSYRENVFSIEFVALEFTNPRKNRYAYRMEGFDDEWIDAGDKREATYTNLDPGSYVFRVRGSNNDGVWNEEGAALSILVTPPFWMTWWFRGILVLGFLSIGPFMYVRRVNALKEQQRLQQDLSERLIALQEEERKRIAMELHDSVGQDLLIVRNKILLGLEADGGSVEKMKEFREAAAFVSKSLTDVREISRNLRPVQLDQLGLTAALESIIETVAQSAHLGHTIDLQNIDGRLSREKEIHVFRIVQECLNNIVKHSDASSFSVTISASEGMLMAVVSDGGRGMDANANQNGEGFGLSGMKERARILGGRMDIRSEPGKGTTVTLTVPLERRQDG